MARNQRSKASQQQLNLLEDLLSTAGFPDDLFAELHFDTDSHDNLSEGQAAVMIKRLQQSKRQQYLNRVLPDSYIIRDMKMLLSKVLTELRRDV